jgi:hypothetical protein
MNNKAATGYYCPDIKMSSHIQLSIATLVEKGNILSSQR